MATLLIFTSPYLPHLPYSSNSSITCGELCAFVCALRLSRIPLSLRLAHETRGGFLRKCNRVRRVALTHIGAGLEFPRSLFTPNIP